MATPNHFSSSKKIYVLIKHCSFYKFAIFDQVYLGRFFSLSSQSLDKIIISPPSLIVLRAALRALNKK